MPANPDNTIILKEPLSGRGRNFLLSKGAEDFDPDSMVEDTGSAPNNFQTITSLKLQLQETSEVLEIGGFLQKVELSDDCCIVELTCLLTVALELVSLKTLTGKLFSATLFIEVQGEKAFEFKILGQQVVTIRSICLASFVGSTALVRVCFNKP